MKKESQNNINLYQFSQKKISSFSFTSHENNSSKIIKRFFNKKINLITTIIFISLLIFVILSAIFYKYSSTKPVLNSVLAENLPPTYIGTVTQTIEVGNFYKLIKFVEANSNFKITNENQFAGLVTLTYNPYDLIYYSSLLNDNKALNINTILGTNSLAIDNFAFFIGSFGVSIVITLAAVTIQFLIGSIFAIYSGYFSNKSLKVSYYIISSFGIIPYMLFCLILFNLVAYSHINAILIMGFIGMPLFFFNSYSHTLELKQKEFIKASMAIGASTNWIIFRILLPRVMVKNLSLFSENSSISLLVLAALSFFNIKSISSYSNIGNVFRQIIDDFSNYGFSFLVIITTTLFILSLKVIGINSYLAFNPQIK